MTQELAAERVTYPGPSGAVTAYLAKSAASPASAIIVIHEFWGLTPHIEDVTRRFTTAGYVALAPDLYSHDDVFRTLTKEDLEGLLQVMSINDQEAALAKFPPERQPRMRHALEWRANRDLSTFVPDLRSAMDYLRTRPDVRGQSIGVVGFCMGGGYSARLATSGADLGAVAIFYGGLPPVENIANIRCPVQAHYGTQDGFATSVVPKLESTMKEHDKSLELHMYEGAPHAFFNDTESSYRADAAKMAWQRTLDFFQRHLKP